VTNDIINSARFSSGSKPHLLVHRETSRGKDLDNIEMSINFGKLIYSRKRKRDMIGYFNSTISSQY
jgi:hypothetical protein